jgi:hypothetical protein
MVDKYHFYINKIMEKGFKSSYQHRYRGYTDRIPQVLVNIYFYRG